MNSLHLQRSIMPPNGFLCAAKQDSVYSATNFNIAVLSSKAYQVLPVGFEVLVMTSGSASSIYGWNGTAWEDEVLSEIVEETNITGAIHFRNPADYDVEFVW